MESWTPQEIGQFAKEAGWSITILAIILVCIVRYGKGIGELIWAVKESVASNTITNESLKETQSQIAGAIVEQTTTQKRISESHAITHKMIGEHTKLDLAAHEETHQHQLTDAERHRVTQELVRAGFDMVRNGLDAIKQVLQDDPTIGKRMMREVSKIETDVTEAQKKV
jgi:hypothetical protein